MNYIPGDFFYEYRLLTNLDYGEVLSKEYQRIRRIFMDALSNEKKIIEMFPNDKEKLDETARCINAILVNMNEGPSIFLKMIKRMHSEEMVFRMALEVDRRNSHYEREFVAQDNCNGLILKAKTSYFSIGLLIGILLHQIFTFFII